MPRVKTCPELSPQGTQGKLSQLVKTEKPGVMAVVPNFRRLSLGIMCSGNA
jgi:hypothetical protein